MEENNNLNPELEPTIPTVEPTIDQITEPVLPTIDNEPLPIIEEMPVAPAIDVPVIEEVIETPVVEEMPMMMNPEPVIQPQEVSPVDFDLNFEDQINQAPAPTVNIAPVAVAPMIDTAMPEVAPENPVQILMPEEGTNEVPAPPQIGSAGYIAEETPAQPTEEAPGPRFQPVAEAENKNGIFFIIIIVVLLAAFVIFLPRIFEFMSGLF